MFFERFFGKRKPMGEPPRPRSEPPQRQQSDPESRQSEAFRASRAVEVVDLISREVSAMVRPGIMTVDIERLVAKITKPTGAHLYFKGYRGYPSIMSLPVNDE